MNTAARGTRFGKDTRKHPGVLEATALLVLLGLEALKTPATVREIRSIVNGPAKRHLTAVGAHSLMQSMEHKQMVLREPTMMADVCGFVRSRHHIEIAR